MQNISPVNWLGTWTLYKRESWRFLKVWNQTVVAPMVTTLLFLAILTLALGGATRMVEGLHYSQFIAPGLLMMAVVQNAFANTSSSLTIAKIQGVIIDILMPPLSAGEITVSLLMGGVTRGLMVAATVGVAIYLFVPFTMHSLPLLIYYLIVSSLMMAALGAIAGIWANSFDQVASVTNYIITPLAFLSGTFYSIHQLPEFWYKICHFNPFFYMIDGARYALTGYSDGSIVTGMWVLLITTIMLWIAMVLMLRSGWRLKS